MINSKIETKKLLLPYLLKLGFKPQKDFENLYTLQHIKFYEIIFYEDKIAKIMLFVYNVKKENFPPSGDKMIHLEAATFSRTIEILNQEFKKEFRKIKIADLLK